MWRSIVFVVLFASVAAAQAPFSNSSQSDKFRKEAALLQGVINDVINNTVPGFGLLTPSRATYLEGFGLVVTLEVSLEPTRNPFSSPKTPAEVRSIVSQRRREIRDKLAALLKERVVAIESIKATESVAVIVHMLNTNPADLPDVPLQLVFTMKKQDALDVQSGKVANASSVVAIREF
jgi:hypothetical protein